MIQVPSEPRVRAINVRIPRHVYYISSMKESKPFFLFIICSCPTIPPNAYDATGKQASFWTAEEVELSEDLHGWTIFSMITNAQYIACWHFWPRLMES